MINQVFAGPWADVGNGLMSSKPTIGPMKLNIPWIVVLLFLSLKWVCPEVEHYNPRHPGTVKKFNMWYRYDVNYIHVSFFLKKQAFFKTWKQCVRRTVCWNNQNVQALKKKKECKFLALSLLMTIICGQIRSVLPIECEPWVFIFAISDITCL